MPLLLAFLLLAASLIAGAAEAQQRFSPAEKERLEAEIRRLGSLCKNQLDMRACDKVLEFPTSAEFRRYFGQIRQEAIRRKAELDYQARITAPSPRATSHVPSPAPAVSRPSDYLGVLSFILFVVAVWKWRTLVKWAYDLFVPHPAEQYVLPAIKSQQPIDAQGVNQALAFDARELDHPPSAHHSQHMARRADALSERLHADTELAHAIERRERAVAAARRAEEELTELQRRRVRS